MFDAYSIIMRLIVTNYSKEVFHTNTNTSRIWLVTVNGPKMLWVVFTKLVVFVPSAQSGLSRMFEAIKEDQPSQKFN